MSIIFVLNSSTCKVIHYFLQNKNKVRFILRIPTFFPKFFKRGIVAMQKKETGQPEKVVANRGTNSANRGTVSANHGTISANHVAISANRGTVSANRGTVSANRGTVSANLAEGMSYVKERRRNYQKESPKARTAMPRSQPIRTRQLK